MVNLIMSCFILLLLLSGCGWDGTPTRHNDFVPLTSIKISAVYSKIAAQTSTKLTATGDFSGLYTRDITDQVVWSSDVPTVAGFANAAITNRVSGFLPGNATLRATVGGISASYTLTVSSATITKSLAITPDALSIAKGLSRQFLVSGSFSDATIQDLTEDVNWTSSATDVATVSDAVASKGLVKTLAVGMSTITATFKDAIGSTLLTVTEPVLQSIELSLNNPSILTLSTKKITATGLYSDGSTHDISSQVTWGSSNPAIATIEAEGTVTTLTQGTTTISATSLDGINKSTTLKVTGGNLTKFSVSPAIVTLAKDTTCRIIATGTFSNGSIRDITGAVKWTAANASLASVAAAGGNLVWLNALTVTPETKITVTSGSLTPFSATLKITAPQLQSIVIIAVSPELTAGTLTAGTLTAGTSGRFTANATFDDGTTQDVTALSTWISKDAAIVTVGTSGLAAGRVTGVATGSTTVSATYMNNGKTVSVLVPAAVTVRSRTLQNLTISPASSSVMAGNQVTFTAFASYSDGTAKDVTEDAAWSTDNSNVAILADNANQPGQLVAVDRGSATITASFAGKTQTATITVTGP